MIKRSLLLLTIISASLCSCATYYYPLATGNEEVYLPVNTSTEKGLYSSFSFEGNYRSSDLTSLMILSFSGGELFSLQGSGSLGYKFPGNKESSFFTMAGTGSIYGGACYLLDESLVFGYGATGQFDFSRSFLYGKKTLHTFGILYAMAYELDSEYKDYRHRLEDLDPNNIDLGSNGLSSTAQIYYEWLSLNNEEGWNPFLRLTIGSNLPETLWPVNIIRNESQWIAKGIYYTGGYLGMRKADISLYAKAQVDFMGALSLSVGCAFQ